MARNSRTTKTAKDATKTEKRAAKRRFRKAGKVDARSY